MNQIQAGDILLFKGTTPIISALVRWFTDSDYTHVGIAVTSDFVYEIDIDRQLAIHPIRDDVYDVFRYKEGLSNEQKVTMQMVAIDRAKTNEGYDWLHILSFGLRKIFKTKKTFEEANKVICSEIVDNLYNCIGIDLIPNKEDGDVLPSDFESSSQLIRVLAK